jgi:AraC-like DNA-binding protein
MRQGIITAYDPAQGVLISTLAHEYPRGYAVANHAHQSHQVIYAIKGVMHVTSGQAVWTVPPHFALWIPARTFHAIRMPEAVSMRTLYIRRDLVSKLPPACMVLHITPLLRELIVEAVRIGKLRVNKRIHCSLRSLIIDQLESASPTPISVALPQDSRARAVANAVFEDPRGIQSLATLSQSVGASVRTIERVFRREVSSSFVLWRRQVRVIKAVELLVSGKSVKETSFALGYRQPTAFVEMFRGIFGETPSAWIRGVRSVNSRRV